MGFSGDLVGAVIGEQMIYEGDDFKSFKDMMTSTIQAADMGDSYPVKHYAMGMSSQNSAMSSGPSASPNSQGSGSTPTPRSTPPTILALSTGASSFTETMPSGGNNAEINSIDIGNLDISAENRQLKDQKMCKICYDNDANIVFLPCGHLVVCEDCSSSIRECPVCRRSIQGILKAYLS
jgi:hypothetical protein